MGFKLGRTRKPVASGGVVKNKLSFKTEDPFIPGHEVIRKNLGPDILGEANMDGSIFISNKIQPGSSEENQVLLHEMRHATDMKLGKLAYSDDAVYYEAEMQKQVTERWKLDMNSDSWLSKNIRPLVLIFLVVCTMLLIFIDAGKINFNVKDSYVDLLQLVLITVIGAYFGGRSLEKVKK
jgi:hypothetical protein